MTACVSFGALALLLWSFMPHPPRSRAVHERAIVIGGSMVGLAVASALRASFREVVVIERDLLPREQPDHRRGVPQSWHIHNLTVRGQRELEDLFPGFVDEAVRLGAMQIDHQADVAAFTSRGWEAQYDSGFIALSATRILLEQAQRNRFFALMPDVSLIEGARATELITDQGPDGQRAVGVRTDHPEHPELRGDLVIDCAGRSSSWKSWFERAGARLPVETVVDSVCGYSSRFYRPRDPASFPWKAMIVASSYPHQPRWGVIVPLEKNHWVVTLGGFSGDFPPSDEAGFMEFARALPTPLYTEALARAEPLTPVRTFRKLEMRWNHFERYDHPIGRFMVLGDAAFAYNPLYGQGMSIGVTCARILRDELAESSDLSDLPRRFYPKAKRFAFPSWEGTALMDMRWPKTKGVRPWHARLSIPISDLIVHAGQCDRSVGLALMDGIHLLKQPHQLITLKMLARVGLYTLKRLTASLPPMRDTPWRPDGETSPRLTASS